MEITECYFSSTALAWLVFILCNIILGISCYFHYTRLKHGGETKNRSSSIPRNWAIVGMLPGLLQNAHRIHEFITDVLKETGGTFEFKGPVFANLDMVITCDPANIHHILSRNFWNYPKGPQFKKIFDVLGDGIFNVDDHLWELHRRTTLSFVKHPQFNKLLETSLWNKIEKGLLPVIDSFVERGEQFDLQDIFQRFTFDNISNLVLNVDPESLSVDLPYVPCEKGFNVVVDTLLYRHLIPESCWKLQKWLGIGKEGKLVQAWKIFDKFIYSSIQKQEQLMMTRGNNNNSDYLSLFSSYVKACEEREDDETMKKINDSTRVFLRDTFLSLMFAGRDTTSSSLTWLFYLLAKNPLAQEKICEEIEEKLNLKRNNNDNDNNNMFFKAEECRELVYLHGALCETLRLYPPVAIEHKVSVEMDVLPSGHQIKPNTRTIMVFYSTGRMEEAWGKDCLEFNPERWITGKGGIKHEPSYKFPAFNAGARTCLGREMAFIQMKMVAATILRRYNFEIVDPHSVSPSDSIILQAKNGLKVKFSQRNVA